MDAWPKSAVLDVRSREARTKKAPLAPRKSFRTMGPGPPFNRLGNSIPITELDCFGCAGQQQWERPNVDYSLYNVKRGRESWR
jgi:hypothetical protein